jgi:hypothetical protein
LENARVVSLCDGSAQALDHAARALLGPRTLRALEGTARRVA